jgi:hypothetical protein
MTERYNARALREGPAPQFGCRALTGEPQQPGLHRSAPETGSGNPAPTPFTREGPPSGVRTRGLSLPVDADCQSGGATCRS